jgi:N-acylneuraminate cytidylyltransferase
MMIAIIPARGGSKRLPGKNIMPFGGRPLLAWSVACALRLNNVYCVVSTDDPSIARAARDAGASVIDRPKELAADRSGMTEVIRHALDTCRRDGRSFEEVMLLQPTNPLRPLELVRSALTRFRSEECDSLITVTRRQLKFGEVRDGHFHPNYRPDTASQSTAPVWFENGLLYLFRSHIVEGGNLYGDRVLAFETDKPFADVDIDEPIDIAIGEAILTTIRDRIDY